MVYAATKDDRQVSHPRESLAKWISVAVTGVVILGSAAFFQGQAKGRAVGESLVKRECADLVAASSWANTPGGPA
jgi:hypothetical protein